MCQKTNYKTPNTRIDKCMVKLIEFINTHPTIKTLGSCCGHGKYNMSIVIRSREQYDSKVTFRILDLISGIEIPRKKRFYKRDKQGYYYIPEVIKGGKIIK